MNDTKYTVQSGTAVNVHEFYFQDHLF